MLFIVCYIISETARDKTRDTDFSYTAICSVVNVVNFLELFKLQNFDGMVYIEFVVLYSVFSF